MENDIRYYSGYIRNWRKLCEELGIEPDCDRESRERQILQKGYTRWGVEIGNHIYGSFAFAIWDVKKQELFCERDQFGTRSFYYYMTEKGEMLCSGSLKELIGENVFVKKINPDALQIYLMFSYPAGEDTLFAGVKKLMPGCCLTWVKGSSQPSIGRYWKAEFIPDDSLPMEEWSDRIHNTFSEIMQEENPEYCESFLSGGVDSSYLLAMSDAKCADSIGYQEEDFDESALSRETAEYLKRDFRRKVIAPPEYFEMIPEVMDYMEQPLGDASAVAFAIGCKEAAKHTNVCYSGEGADEFFGGYYGYESADILAADPAKPYLGCTMIMDQEELKSLLLNYNDRINPYSLVKSIYEEISGSELLNRMIAIDLAVWLEGDIFLNVDKMSKAFGLEVRTPLSDRRMFDVAARIPEKYKIHNGQYKFVFRKAAAKVLPEETAFRKKVGFAVPIRKWLADSLHNSDVINVLSGEDAGEFFHTDYLKKLWSDYLSGKMDLWRPIYAIYAFLIWYRRYFH